MKHERLIMLQLFAILTLALSACGPENREICQSHDDCLPCEQCKNGTCVLDESRLNACGECDQPDPEEICGDGLDNDCDGETDESCEGSCVGVVCDSPPGPCLASPGACRDGVCGYPPLDDGTACDDQDGCTTDDACTSGVCFGSPVTCDAPPQNECFDENTLRSYSANGTCEDGDCAYAHNDIDCLEGCHDGFCKGDPCATVVCDTPPSECYQPEGFCSKGICHYGYRDGVSCDDGDGCTQSDTCSSGICTGAPVTCDSPPPNSCLDENTMRSYTANGVCIDGICSYGYQDVTCTNGCEAGLCKGDPCEGVSCDNPPTQCYLGPGTCDQGVCHYGLLDGAACDDSDACTRNDTCKGGNCTGTPMICDTPPGDVCLDGSTLRAYSSAGSCEAGACVYPFQDVACTHGCLNGFCNEDPCAGVVCDDPPSQCHRSPGTCVGGSCQYGYLDGAACDDSDACTQNDTCQDGSCAGTPRICNNPPPNECLDANTLRSYGSSGSCSAGSCEYPHQDITCADGCSNGRCNEDPCIGVVCNTPSSVCYGSDGVCVDGDCHYPYRDGIPCDDGDPCTVDDVCDSGDCLGTICNNSIPADECNDSTSVKRYTGEGFCVEGSCDYPYQVVPCEDRPSACHEVTGACDQAICHYDPITMCSGGDGCCPSICDGSSDNDCSVITWARTYAGSEYDSASYIEQTSDGYIMVGRTGSFGAGDFDAWVVKLDFRGDVVWQKTYGGDKVDWIISIQQTSDGGYIFAGHTESFNTGDDADLWVVKLGSRGDVTWQKTYGTPKADYTHGDSIIQQTSDGGYVLVAKTYYGQVDGDIWVLKLNPNGDVVWNKKYVGDSKDTPGSIQQTSDGGFIVAGETNSFGSGSSDAWVIKLDSSGDVIWQKTYGGSEPDGAKSIRQTSDGGYIVSGSTESFSFSANSEDVWILKLSSSGEVVWQMTYGFPRKGRSIRQTSDGGYVVAGDRYIVKLDSQGSMVWRRGYDGPVDDVVYIAQQASDGGFIAAGATASFGNYVSAWVLKVDTNGIFSESFDCPYALGVLHESTSVGDSDATPEDSNAYWTSLDGVLSVNDTDALPSNTDVDTLYLCGNISYDSCCVPPCGGGQYCKEDCQCEPFNPDCKMFFEYCDPSIPNDCCPGLECDMNGIPLCF